MAKKPELTETDKLKEAAALLDADRENRSKQFLEELQQLCAKYGCELKPMLQVVAK